MPTRLECVPVAIRKTRVSHANASGPFVSEALGLLVSKMRGEIFKVSPTF